MRRLVIAEKFSAALRLATILSEGMAKKVRVDGVSYFEFSTGDLDVIVFPLRGHVIELDYPEAYRDWSKVVLTALIDVEPTRRESRPDILQTLRRLGSEADEVVIATDFDREGELIGIEALEGLREARPGLAVKRARFSAMTASEIRRAFSDLTAPDWNLAQAAAARQKIDLAWGAVLTRFLSLHGGLKGRLLSVGRVQTPTLALLAEREREREDHVSRPFWNVIARVGEPEVEAVATGGPFWERAGAEATAALAQLDSQADVVAVEEHEERDPPPAPFNTTSFLVEASRLRLSAPRAMAVAQRLYERGEISYPRTDNTVYPPSLNLRGVLEHLRGTKHHEIVESLLDAPRLRSSRGPLQTTDHPPVYPTSSPSKAQPGPMAMLYDLVVRRFLATVSSAALRAVTTGQLQIGDAAFVVKRERLVEPGWRQAYEGRSAEPATGFGRLQQGDGLRVHGVRILEDRTRPPPLHSQASLLMTMERLRLGTKSTRHEVVDILYRRRYMEGRALRTTAAGRTLVDSLGLYAHDIVGAEMTRHLETRMDAIAEGRATLEDVVAESRSALHDALEGLEAHEASIGRWLRDADYLETDFGPCEACGKGRRVLRRTKTGWTFLGCSTFPECRHYVPMGHNPARLPWAIQREEATSAA